MGTIRSGIGLASGVNNNQIIDSLIKLQQAPIVRLQQRAAGFQQTQTAVKTLEANLLSITTAVQQLGETASFNKFTVANSDTAQLSVAAAESAVPGKYQFQSVRTATTFSALSKGFVNQDQQAVGSGTLTIATGGFLDSPTLLDALNDGSGVRRGSIRITDRSGNTADIDLSNAYSAQDVLDAINNSTTISVTASAVDGRFVLTDASGNTASNLTVTDLNGGHTAEDLGIVGTVAADRLDGQNVFQVFGDFRLDQINDGNGVQLFKGAPDIQFTLTDDTVLDVNLDGSVTLNDVISAINNDPNNGGKVSAALSGGRLVLTDLSGGGGSSAFSVQDQNNGSVIRQLGLNITASGGTITGGRLIAGIDSVLLRNLRGGQGIDQPGQITLTDRSGATATVDLSAAESLGEILDAINSAKTTGGIKLKLTARVNATGNGLTVNDTSGSSTSNLIIADVGTGTTATQLGIAVNAAQQTVDSGSLSARYVNNATDIGNYAPDGGAVDPGSIRITDSAGNQDVIVLSSAVKTIGDVLQRLNAASTASVHAQLNDTGDGFVLIDDAGGTGTLSVEDVDGTTAADLKLTGSSALGGDGKQRISSRSAAVVNVTAGETLDDVVAKINAAAGFATASVFDDGSAFNPQHLRLTSTVSGSGGKLLLDDTGLNFGLNTLTDGADALLRIGGTVESGFLVSSKTNSFNNAATGIDVTVRAPGNGTAEVTIARDTTAIESTVQSFVDGYNAFVGSAADLTKFDANTQTRGPLQGRGVVLRAQSRLQTLVSRQLLGSTASVRSLIDLGVRTGADGKLSFDKTRLDSALASNPQQVFDFFLTTDTGFADVAQKTVDSLTDPLTGAFSLEETSLQSSVDTINARVEQLNTLLQRKRDRLIQQFAAMESAISQLTSQQQSLGGISGLSINPIRSGLG